MAPPLFKGLTPAEVRMRAKIKERFRKARIYEEERLLLAMQEVAAEAIECSGRMRRTIARAIGVSPPSLSQAFSRGASIERLAAIAWAAGYRITVGLEKIP
jgi:hypothetical protein